MRYVAAFFILFFCSEFAYPYIRYIFLSASNFTSGTLPNERLDGSSVTLKGNGPAYELGQGTVTIGAIRVSTGQAGNNTFRFPTADGTSGQVIHTDGIGNWSFADDDTLGGGSVSASTVTFNLGRSGIPFVSTTGVCAYDCFSTGRGTFTVIGYQGYVTRASSIGLVAVQVNLSTSSDMGNQVNYFTQRSTVAVNTRYANFVSSTILVNSNNTLDLHISSVQTGPGLQPRGVGIAISGWWHIEQ